MDREQGRLVPARPCGGQGWRSEQANQRNEDMMTRLLFHLRALADDQRGNIAIITAFTIFVVFGILGFALDYAVALNNKTRLDGAARAAALTAINSAQIVLQGNGTQAAAISAGQTAGLAAFRANAGAILFSTGYTPSVSVTPNGAVLTASVTYTSTSTSLFSQLIGIPQVNISGNLGATLTMPSYINYHLVIDVSQSMGIADDAANMTLLFKRVIAYGNSAPSDPGGCVFACHVAEVGQNYSNEYLAHNIAPKVQLRIDSAVQAVQTMISAAQNVQASITAQGGSPLIQIALYTMNQDPTNPGNYLTKIQALTTNYTSLANVAANITLGNNVPGGNGDTNFPQSFSQFASTALPAAMGTGTQATPLNYVFIITDGLQDTPGTIQTCPPSGHCTQALDPTICTPLKSKATVGVIYTTYTPIYVNNDPNQPYDINYQNLVAPYVGSIPGNLQSCASTPTPLWYYQASNNASIQAGMAQLMANSARQARLTR
jgi:Flp pilus assembly protein TadG